MDTSTEQPSGRSIETWRGWWFVLGFAALVLIARFLPFDPVQDFFHHLSWVTRETLTITKRLFRHYGYLTVFLAPLMENTVLLGALIPGVLVMMLAGLSAHDGLIDLWRAIPLGIAGACIGDTISYGIGRFGWRRLGAESRLVRWSEEMRESLLKHSVWFVLVYHFAGYSRLIGPAAAGFIRMPLSRWMVLDYAGAAIWVTVYMVLGYMLGVFGLSLDASDRNVRVMEAVLFVLGASAVVLVLVRARRREAEPARSETPA